MSKLSLGVEKAARAVREAPVVVDPRMDVILAMTVGVVEVARTGREALINDLVAGGLTELEAQTAVDEVIQVRLSPTARKARVQQLRDQGMSQRQIAAAVGISKGAVSRDLAPPGAAPSSPPVQPEAPTAPDGAARAPDLRTTAKQLPTTDHRMRAQVDAILSELEDATPRTNQPVTDEKIAEARRLMDRLDEFRQEWLPYIQPTLREV